MNKYDFGYEIQQGSTTEWAYSKIMPKSEVLELGPAIGTLAKHLKEEKHCLVDIVEIDTDSGKLAEKFARNACVGEIEGDLDGNKWFDIYKYNRYDCIVLLDVIEHLKYPKKLLQRLYELLKPEGKVLVSTPNIAHNSIIINLFNNKFQYTDLGILDSTHLKFFTYYSLCELFHDIGYVIANKEYKQIIVGENEIKCNYKDVPREFAACLRKRPFADVYQFAFVLKKNGEEATSDIPKNLPFTNYVFETYQKGILYSQKFFQDDDFETEIILDEERDENFRIDPINVNTIIRNISLWDVEKNSPVEIKITNGEKIDNNTFVFYDDDPQIIIDTTHTGSVLKFNCHFEVIDSKGIAFLKPLWEQILMKKSENTDLKQQIKKIIEVDSQIQVENQSLQEKNSQMQEKNQSLQERNNQIQVENQNLQEKNNWIQVENQSLQEKNSQMQEKNQKLELRIDELEKEIETIQNTKFWNLYSKIFKLK